MGRPLSDAPINNLVCSRHPRHGLSAHRRTRFVPALVALHSACRRFAGISHVWYMRTEIVLKPCTFFLSPLTRKFAGDFPLLFVFIDVQLEAQNSSSEVAEPQWPAHPRRTCQIGLRNNIPGPRQGLARSVRCLLFQGEPLCTDTKLRA